MSDIKQQLETSGVAISKMPSGIPVTRYYTPDGREELKVAQYRIRGIFSKTEKDSKGNPKLLEEETYDIFLDQGYSLTKPEHPKPYCAGCDRWHDTQEEVDACVELKKKKEREWEEKANHEVKKEQMDKDKKIAELESKLDKLTKLVEANLGKVL